MKTLKIILCLLLCAIAPSAWGQITARTNPGSGSGCSNNGATQGTSLVVTPQGVSAGDFLAIWITEINTALVTSASVSGSGPFTATVNFTNPTGLTLPTSGSQARISGFSTAGYNCNLCSVTASTPTSISYTVSSSLASCATTAACGSNPAVTTPVSLTDNATTPNTYTEVTGAFVPMTDGEGINDPGSAWTFFTPSLVLASGSVAPIITVTPGNSSFIGVCVMGFAGVSGTVDSSATNFYQTDVTSIPTPSIAGSVQPELFIGNSYINGSTQPMGACGGQTFTVINPTDEDNGDDAGYFISSGLGSFCAGFSQGTAQKGAVSIASFKGTGATGGVVPVVNKRAKLAKLLDE
jgi:hypothetical protein